MAEVINPFEDDKGQNSPVAGPPTDDGDEIYLLDDEGFPIDENGNRVETNNNADRSNDDIPNSADLQDSIASATTQVEMTEEAIDSSVDQAQARQSELAQGLSFKEAYDLASKITIEELDAESQRTASREEGFREANKVIEEQLDLESQKIAEAKKAAAEAEKAAEIARREQFLKDNPLLADAFNSSPPEQAQASDSTLPQADKSQASVAQSETPQSASTAQAEQSKKPQVAVSAKATEVVNPTPSTPSVNRLGDVTITDTKLEEPLAADQEAKKKPKGGITVKKNIDDPLEGLT